MIKKPVIFKSDQGRARYMAAYERALAAWPVSYQTQYVRTSYGQTHVVSAGEPDAPPLVLMHGKGGSATMWEMNVAALSRYHRVYAIDLLGDVGKSEASKLFDNRAGFAEWLTEVLDGLDLGKVDMVGLSLGGFLTTSYAIERPERLNRIVLLAPGGTFAAVRSSFLLRGIFSSLTGSELLIKRFLASMSATDSFMDSELISQMMLGLKYDNFAMKFIPKRLSDDELSRIKVPVLLLVGENENVNRGNPELVIKRAERLIENIQTAVLPGAVHMLNAEEPDLVNEMINRFLSNDE